jgi:serine/threonine protein kinase
MAHAHSKGIVHGDLLLHNVFLDENFEVLIGNFSLSNERSVDDKSFDDGPRSCLDIARCVDEPNNPVFFYSVDIACFVMMIFRMFSDSRLPLRRRHRPPLREWLMDFFLRTLPLQCFICEHVPEVLSPLITTVLQEIHGQWVTFKRIAEAFVTSDELYLPGTDRAQFLEYASRMMLETIGDPIEPILTEQLKERFKSILVSWRGGDDSIEE